MTERFMQTRHGLVASAEGDWVGFADYAALQSRVAKLSAALDACAGQAYDAGTYGETEANERLAQVRHLAAVSA
jgi:hypothetical protein